MLSIEIDSTNAGMMCEGGHLLLVIMMIINLIRKALNLIITQIPNFVFYDVTVMLNLCLFEAKLRERKELKWIGFKVDFPRPHGCRSFRKITSISQPQWAIQCGDIRSSRQTSTNWNHNPGLLIQFGDFNKQCKRNETQMSLWIAMWFNFMFRVFKCRQLSSRFAVLFEV